MKSLIFMLFLMTLKSYSNDFLELNDEIIEWRRYLHENPELSNREFNTSKFVSEKLIEFGLEVQTNIAHTGVVAVLVGNASGPTVALRADMDALPISENVDLKFRSYKKTVFNGDSVGVMHACGHDAHVAILLATAKYLSENKSKLKGKVKFIFQPAEEGAPNGEEGGASLMIKEGVLKKPDVDVIFGLHVMSKIESGKIAHKAGGFMAAVDKLEIVVKGKQSHGARPWSSVDPIIVSSQIINSLQTIVSRKLNISNEPAVISIGKINGGVRSNIIPEKVELLGTIRSLDPDMQKTIHENIRKICTNLGEAHGAKVDVNITELAPVTYNELELSEWSKNVLNEKLGSENVVLTKPSTVGEDFAYYQQIIPGFYFSLGVRPIGLTENEAPEHHTAEFYIDESNLWVGVKAFTELTLEYLNSN